MTNPLFAPAPCRRGFIRLAVGGVGALVLAGCGGGEGSTASSPATVAAAAAGTLTTLSDEVARLNLALNLEYLGAQFHSFASSGTGLPAGSTSGVGQQGAATGGRAAALADTLVRQHAAELAVDKLAHVGALRQQLAGSAAAQPTLDLSPAGAFAAAARSAGITSGGAAFDPYADDNSYLLASFLIENVVAATYRSLLAQASAADATQLLSAHLADAIYHGGLVRSLLAARAVDDPTLGGSLTALCSYLATLDGSAAGDQDVATATGDSSNLTDAEGRPIPFTRNAGQALKTVYLTPVLTSAGGFLPAGANGVRV